MRVEERYIGLRVEERDIGLRVKRYWAESRVTDIGLKGRERHWVESTERERERHWVESRGERHWVESRGERHWVESREREERDIGLRVEELVN